MESYNIDDVVGVPEERGAACELCGVLGDVSRHQGHHLVCIIFVRIILLIIFRSIINFFIGPSPLERPLRCLESKLDSDSHRNIADGNGDEDEEGEDDEAVVALD